MDSAKKILSIFLLLVVVAYSGGIKISKHLCKGKVVSRAINHEAKVCKRAKCEINFSDRTAVSKKSCCDSESDFFKSFNFEENTTANNFILANAYFYFPTISIPVITSTSSRVDYYEPPPNVPIYIRVERFLI